MGRLIETRHENPLHWETHDITSDVIFKKKSVTKFLLTFFKTENFRLFIVNLKPKSEGNLVYISE